MALTESEIIPRGSAAPDFDLPDPDGARYTLASFTGEKGLVVMFICNHCPYVQAVEQRLIDLARQFQPLGISFVAIMPNDVERYPADGPEKMKERAEAYGYPFPYLYDEDQSVARAYGAVCTPDLFVFDGERRLSYHGRIDDNWKDPAVVTRHEMADALEALVEGRRPADEQIPSMGCSIKWK